MMEQIEEKFEMANRSLMHLKFLIEHIMSSLPRELDYLTGISRAHVHHVNSLDCAFGVKNTIYFGFKGIYKAIFRRGKLRFMEN